MKKQNFNKYRTFDRRRNSCKLYTRYEATIIWKGKQVGYKSDSRLAIVLVWAKNQIEATGNGVAVQFYCDSQPLQIRGF